MLYEELDDKIRWAYKEDLYARVRAKGYNFVSELVIKEYYSGKMSGRQIAECLDRTQEWFYSTLRKWGFESLYLTGGPFRSERLKTPKSSYRRRVLG